MKMFNKKNLPVTLGIAVIALGLAVVLYLRITGKH